MPLNRQAGQEKQPQIHQGLTVCRSGGGGFCPWILADGQPTNFQEFNLKCGLSPRAEIQRLGRVRIILTKENSKGKPSIDQACHISTVVSFPNI